MWLREYHSFKKLGLISYERFVPFKVWVSWRLHFLNCKLALRTLQWIARIALPSHNLLSGLCLSAFLGFLSFTFLPIRHLVYLQYDVTWKQKFSKMVARSQCQMIYPDEFAWNFWPKKSTKIATILLPYLRHSVIFSNTHLYLPITQALCVCCTYVFFPCTWVWGIKL